MRDGASMAQQYYRTQTSAEPQVRQYGRRLGCGREQLSEPGLQCHRFVGDMPVRGVGVKELVGYLSV